VNFCFEISLRFQQLEHHFLFPAEQGFFHERTGNYQEPIREFGPTLKASKSLRRGTKACCGRIEKDWGAAYLVSWQGLCLPRHEGGVYPIPQNRGMLSS
jgi:hypothetical protein